MDINYYRDNNSKYLVIKQNEGTSSNYQMQMLSSNEFEMMISCQKRSIDLNEYLYYDIGERIELKSICENKKFNAKKLLELLEDVLKCLSELEKFLMDLNYIVFSISKIFYDPATSKYSFIFYVDDEVKNNYTLPKLFEELSDYIDSSDENAVDILYSLWDEIKKSSSNYNEIIKRHISNNKELLSELATYSCRIVNENNNADYDDEKYGASENENEGLIKKPISIFNKDGKNNKSNELDREVSDKMKFKKLGYFGFIFFFFSLFVISTYLRSAYILTDTEATSSLVISLLSILMICAAILNYKKEKKDVRKHTSIDSIIKQMQDENEIEIYEEERINKPRAIMTGFENENSFLGNEVDRYTDFKGINDDVYSGNDTGVDNMHKIEVDELTVPMPIEEKIYGILINADDDSGDNEIILNKLPFIIGRNGSENDYSLNDNRISRRHLEIIEIDNDLYIRDNNSTNGTYQNGDRLPGGESLPLSEGDEIAFGAYKFKFASAQA